MNTSWKGLLKIINISFCGTWPSIVTRKSEIDVIGKNNKATIMDITLLWDQEKWGGWEISGAEVGN